MKKRRPAGLIVGDGGDVDGDRPLLDIGGQLRGIHGRPFPLGGDGHVLGDAGEVLIPGKGVALHLHLRGLRGLALFHGLGGLAADQGAAV